MRARLAERAGVLQTRHGPMPYRAGEHYLVAYRWGDRALVRRDVFEQLYERLKGNCYLKRRDIVLRYFTLPHDATIETSEGPELAKRGDWIVESIDGGLYPVAKARARDIYETISAPVR